VYYLHCVVRPICRFFYLMFILATVGGSLGSGELVTGELKECIDVQFKCIAYVNE